MRTTDEEAILHIPGALDWLQDMNWPVAPKIASRLRALEPHLAPHLHKILNGPDAQWILWILDEIVGKSPLLVRQLESDLLRLSAYQGEDEDWEEAAAGARAILVRYR